MAVNRAELLKTFLPATLVPVTMILYVPIDVFLAACTVVIEAADPPAGTLTPLGLKMTVIPLGTCAISVTVPVKPCVLRMVIVELAFIPCGTVIADGLIVRRKLPVTLWASLIARGSTVPLTVKEPNAKVRSRSRALRGTRFLDRLVTHSSELNPWSILCRSGTLRVL